METFDICLLFKDRFTNLKALYFQRPNVRCRCISSYKIQPKDLISGPPEVSRMNLRFHVDESILSQNDQNNKYLVARQPNPFKEIGRKELCWFLFSRKEN